MNNVSTLLAGSVTPKASADLEAFDKALVAAINESKRQGLPQGFIVAVLHAHAHHQTEEMLRP